MSLFDDIFEVLEVDPGGKKFDKVSRFKCRSDLYEMDLQLDINVDIYPLLAGDKFSLLLTRTITLDNSNTLQDFAGLSDSRGNPLPTKMDDFEYVMHGKVFKYKELAAGGGYRRLEIYTSFGGLLMLLAGDASKLTGLEEDTNVYLLMRKV